MKKIQSGGYVLIGLLFAVLSFGCSDGDGGGGAGTTVDITIRGDSESAEAHFKGKNQPISMTYFDSHGYLNLMNKSDFKVDEIGGDRHISQLILGLDDGAEEGKIYDANYFDFLLTTHGFKDEEGKPTTQNLKITGVDGTVTIEKLSDTHVRLRFDTEASPTQMGSKNLVFRVTGTVEVRK